MSSSLFLTGKRVSCRLCSEKVHTHSMKKKNILAKDQTNRASLPYTLFSSLHVIKTFFLLVLIVYCNIHFVCSFSSLFAQFFSAIEENKITTPSMDRRVKMMNISGNNMNKTNTLKRAKYLCKIHKRNRWKSGKKGAFSVWNGRNIKSQSPTKESYFTILPYFCYTELEKMVSAGWMFLGNRGCFPSYHRWNIIQMDATPSRAWNE